ncbi:MAG: Wzz/FepE/Etk N-terminal domain-containing protein, partial [Candidatus Magnetominusculus sp. LBB02]|nr:Wzz/FepE/Etk N-terminal domain-containing protein [Candidatus Magnetominusculus sp. LBB02]
MHTENVQEDYKRALLTTFFIQKRIIFATAIVIFTASVLVSFFWPRTYASYGSIFVKGEKAEKTPGALEKEEIRSHDITREDLNSESEILISADVIKNTISQLKSQKLYKQSRPSLMSLVYKLINKAAASDAASNSEIYQIKKCLSTEIVPTTNVIKITMTDHDPKYAVLFLNTLMEQFMKYRAQLYTTEETKLFFSQQVTDARQGLEEREDKLLSLYKKGETILPAKEIENNLFMKKDLEQDLYYLKQSAMEKTRLLKYIEKALKNKEVNYFSFIEGNESITNLSKSLQDLVAEGGPIVAKYKKDTETYHLFNDQVNAMYNALRKEVEGYALNIRRQLDTINDKIDAAESRIDKINAQNVKFQELLVMSERIKRDIDLYKASYDIFSKRNEESRILSSPTGGNLQITILSKAFPSSGQIFPIPSLL